MSITGVIILDEVQHWESLDPYVQAPPMPGRVAVEEARRLQLVTPTMSWSWSRG